MNKRFSIFIIATEKNVNQEAFQEIKEIFEKVLKPEIQKHKGGKWVKKKKNNL